MRVTVVCFGALRDYLPAWADGNRAELELRDGARVSDALSALNAPSRLAFVLLVDGQRAEPHTLLEEGAEVTLMPPFTGGS